VVVACCGALVALGALAMHWVGGREVGWAACRADPVLHAGTAVVLPLHDVSRLDLGTGELWVSQSWRDVPVVAAALPEGLQTGDVVSVVGTCAAQPARVVADRVGLHPLCPWKEGLGMLGLGLWLLSLPWCLRKTPSGWVLRGDRSGSSPWPTS
jgi:hypothetical protein